MWYSLSQKFDPMTGTGYFDFSDTGINNPNINYDDIIFEDYGEKIVAYCNGQILGWIVHYTEPEEKTSHIEWIYTKPEYRNMGVGDALMRNYKEMILKNKIKRVSYDAHHPSTLNLGVKYFGHPRVIQQADSFKSMPSTKDNIAKIQEELTRRLKDIEHPKYETGMPYGEGWILKHNIKK